MRLLLDTHIALWAALAPETLTDRERELITAAEGPLVLSAVSVWELRLKWHSLHVSGARKGVVDPADLVAFAGAMGWRMLPMTAGHAAARLEPGLAHKDPFDELLLVQAREEGLQLLTRDGKLVGRAGVVGG